MTGRAATRVARVIARLNVGGPALHVLAASAGLRPDFDTTLLAGAVGPGEAEAAAWMRRFGVDPVRVPGLGRAPSPLDDLRAWRFLLRTLHETRPEIVHTHTAKAGALGRLAARRARVPFVVHTFHGHVFDGYFGAAASRAVVAAERRLARRTDRIVAVSEEVAHDLVVRHRVASASQVVVIPVGLPLDDFAAAASRRGPARVALGLGADAPVAAMVGRLVDVKEPGVALAAWARVREAVPGAILLVAGDGPLRADLERRAPPGVRFLGWRDDVADLWAAADVAVLTSRNEGTPVALIEAAASGVPAVATRVGGVPSVVVHGETGRLVAVGEAAAVADEVIALLRGGADRATMGAAARARVVARFSLARLLGDLRALYAGR